MIDIKTSSVLVPLFRETKREELIMMGEGIAYIMYCKLEGRLGGGLRVPGVYWQPVLNSHVCTSSHTEAPSLPSLHPTQPVFAQNSDPPITEALSATHAVRKTPIFSHTETDGG